MTILFEINDPIAELNRLLDDEFARRDGAITQAKRAYHNGAITAYKVAIETLDAANRFAESGSPVEMRTYQEIIDERVKSDT